MLISAESQETTMTMTMFDQQVAATREWFASPRFDGLVRLYSPRQVAEQQGTISGDYTVARRAAEEFYARLRELFEQRRQITTFGPYSPGQAVMMKRIGMEGIYLGGWATSAKGSMSEDPGPDLASYPLSQVPDEAAGLVRALLTADKNQHFARVRMTEEQRKATPAIDYRPFIVADADTGHGGDAHVRNLIRRLVEVGVPGYHIEDQKPGAKKCGHQGGKVLVAEDEQIKRLNAARLQLDIMRVPGILVARTDAESATFLENRSDERDQPFILGATNIELPSYKAGYLAILRKLFELGVEEVRGHLLFAVSEAEYLAAFAWLERVGLMSMIAETCPGSQGYAGNRARRRTRQDRHALCGNLAGGSRAEDLWAGGRRGDGVPHGRGRSFRHDRRGMAGVLETGFFLRGTRASEVDGHPGDLGLRAAQDSRRLLSDPSRDRLRHRQVAGCGALRRRAVDGDQDGGSRGCRGSSRTPSTRSIPTRCWRTTSRRRSAGTPRE